MKTQLQRLFILTLLLSIGLSLAGSCASTGSGNEALLKISMPPAGDSDTEPRGAPTIKSAPTLDERDIEDNQLAMIEQLRSDRESLRGELETVSAKLQRHEKKSSMNLSQEAGLEDDIDRLQNLLKASQERERELQRQLLLARLEAVRQEQAAVREQIGGIGSTNDGQ
ncbi:MAG: hypothetical protein V3W41_17205 [Planctomycetota bacterium]